MEQDISSQKPAATGKSKAVKWLKKIGIAGFLFFLIKGLVWLAVGYWILK